LLPVDTLLGLAVFAAVASVTPGPNTLMVMTSGMNFGLRRTVPHMLGIAIGFTVMIVMVGLGLAKAFTTLPWLHIAMKIAGVLYMLRLAWMLARSGSLGVSDGRPRPMTFFQAAAFQWINPKAWAIAFSALAAYAVPGDFTLSVLLVAMVFMLVSLPSNIVWAAFGIGVARFLGDPRTTRIFNTAMAVLLAASLWPAISELVSLL
jgi:threonine/homoserine/homoserine lactone efflux protein